MLLFKSKKQLNEHLTLEKSTGIKVGFVPTMGALHGGHLSLIEDSKRDNDLTVCSIFVNPTQFNNKEDLIKYPRSIENDIKLLDDIECDILFLPEIEEIYGAENQGNEIYDLGYLDTILEGAHRPGHFQGVSQIMDKLLTIIPADNLYMGQKDYQQCLIVKKLIKDESFGTTINLSPIVREADGLAMSSRNVLLTEFERAKAGLIYQCLVSIQAKKDIQSFDIIKKECEEILERKGLQPNYVNIADAETLEILNNFEEGRKMIALISVTLGKVRLIDNLLL